MNVYLARNAIACEHSLHFNFVVAVIVGWYPGLSARGMLPSNDSYSFTLSLRSSFTDKMLVNLRQPLLIVSD